jgi:hypothetical protein
MMTGMVAHMQCPARAVTMKHSAMYKRKALPMNGGYGSVNGDNASPDRHVE